MYEVLMRSPLFRGLGAEQIEALMDGITYQIKSFGRGEIIAYSGDLLSSQPQVLVQVLVQVLI